MKAHYLKYRPHSKVYLAVLWEEKSPNKIQLQLPGTNFKFQFDARMGPDLILAINDLCRQAGHAYIPDLGERE